MTVHQKKSILASNVASKTYISNVIEHGRQVDVILTDFKKAFDIVVHIFITREFGLFGTDNLHFS